METRKRFTKDFKLEAVRLLERSGRPGAEIARELGMTDWLEKAERETKDLA